MPLDSCLFACKSSILLQKSTKSKPFGTTGPELTDIEKRLLAVEKKLAKK